MLSGVLINSRRLVHSKGRLIWVAKALFLSIKIKSINQNMKVIQRVNIVGIVHSRFFELIVPLVATRYTILHELYTALYLSFFHEGVIKNVLMW